MFKLYIFFSLFRIRRTYIWIYIIITSIGFGVKLNSVSSKKKKNDSPSSCNSVYKHDDVYEHKIIRNYINKIIITLQYWWYIYYILDTFSYSGAKKKKIVFYNDHFKFVSVENCRYIFLSRCGIKWWATRGCGP